MDVTLMNLQNRETHLGYNFGMRFEHNEREGIWNANSSIL